MLKNVWRCSHLCLAIISSLFLLLASITGVILAFEPINTVLTSANQANLEEVKLNELIPKIKNQYDEVFELKRTKDDLIVLSALDALNEIDGEFILDIQDASKLTETKEQSKLFEFTTTLHRSLFLKNTGRWIVGINSFFLVLIVLSGTVLIAKRQLSWYKFFSKIIRLDFPSYSHTWLGRLMLFPILIISASAVVLFLIRFDYLPDKPQAYQEFEVNPALEQVEIQNFKTFQQTSLKDLISLEFPFSDFEEDYYLLKTTQGVYHIHQYTGQILASQKASAKDELYTTSLFLHTGKGSLLWSFVLALSALSLLYFIVTGFILAKRRFKSKPKNKTSIKEATIVILYGSQSGSTKKLAYTLFNSLIKHKNKAYITELNKYQPFPSIQHLVIFTSTYGHGEPPNNASNFLDLIDTVQQSQNITYSIVGFGSSQYPNFCAFAVDIHQKLKNHNKYKALLDLKLIDNQNNEAFVDWWIDWTNKTKLNLNPPKKIQTIKPKTIDFTIIDKSIIDDGYGETFLLKIKSKNKDLQVQSGDLLGVFPPNENHERFYSIGVIKNEEILIAVKLHNKGVCSNYLYTLQAQQTFKAYIKQNPSFYMDKDATSVTFIANGTGIAPFLGMLKNNRDIDKTLFFGVRNQKSLSLYKNYIHESNMKEYYLSFSKESQEYKYVQDWVKNKIADIQSNLQDGGNLMICGSKAMCDDVFKLLDCHALANDLPLIEFWQKKGSIKVDTY